MERIDHLLPWSSLGSERRLSVFRYGKGPRKVYIQSSLHADELPGMRTAWELKLRLADLESRGQLNCVVELVPVANPIGLVRPSRPATWAVSSSPAGRTSTAISSS